jgi:hypothetical protein
MNLHSKHDWCNNGDSKIDMSYIKANTIPVQAYGSRKLRLPEFSIGT